MYQCLHTLKFVQTSNYLFELSSNEDWQGQPITVWVSPAMHLGWYNKKPRLLNLHMLLCVAHTDCIHSVPRYALCLL